MTLLLAAVGATVAALFELTVGPYLVVGDAQPHLVLVGTVVVTIVVGLEPGLVWAFVGGLALDVLADRPLGSTAFALLLCAGGASIIGRLLARIRPLAPIIATFVLSIAYSMMLFTLDLRPSRAASGHRPARDRPSGRHLQHDPGRDHRAAGGLDPRSTRAARTGRLVSAYIGGRAAPAKQLSRFLVFGLIVIIAMGTLTARLFYLQIINGSQASALAAKNRTVLESIPSPRGLIYDRNGRALVTNIPTFAVKLRPTDLPVERRPEVVQRLAAMLKIDPTEINTAIDSNPGSAFDLVRIAEDIDADTARLIQESSDAAPGRRRRRRGAPPVHRRTAPVPDHRVHRARSRRRSSPRSRNAATCPTTSSARPASNRRTRPSSAASTAPRPSSATPAARRRRSCGRTPRSSRAIR